MNLEIILTLGPPYVNNFSKIVIQQEWKNQDKRLFLLKCGFNFLFAN
jgi:hypothetical protein